MSALKKAFSRTRKRMIAFVTVAALLVVSLALFLSSTLARDDDVVKTFPAAVSNTAMHIPLGPAQEIVSGVFKTTTSAPTIATSAITGAGGRVSITPIKPGVAAVAFVSSVGSVLNREYQIYDPNGIAGYRIPGGKTIIANATSAPTLVDLRLTINNGTPSEITFTAWNSANPTNRVTWESQHEDIAEINPTTGYVTPKENGAAIMIATVTDKWGTEREIPVLVRVGTSNDLIPDPGNNGGSGDKWYRPLKIPKHVYEIVDKDGNPKQPPEYVYDEDKDGDPTTGTKRPVYGPKNGIYYVEDPVDSNIYKPLDNNGNILDDNAIWGGNDGEFGTEDDRPIVKNGGRWFANLGQNIYLELNPTTGALIGLEFGAGQDGIPGTVDDLKTSFILYGGKYYAGPFKDTDDVTYYVGDSIRDNNGVNTSGNGSNGHVTPIDSTDRIYYMDENGDMVTTKPSSKPDYSVGDEFTMDGVAWVVIGTNVGANKDMLIMTKYVHGLNEDGSGGSQWQPAPATTTRQYSSSTLKTSVDAFYAGLGELRDYAVKPKFIPPYGKTTEGTDSLGVKAGSETSGILFPLSYAQVNALSSTLRTGYNAANKSNSVAYWTRTVSTYGDYYVYTVNTTGNLDWSTYNTRHFGMRLAMYVNFES